MTRQYLLEQVEDAAVVQYYADGFDQLSLDQKIHRSARREAERGTFDPMYLVYSVGKLMLMKLRQDYKERQGGKFSLRAFHDAVLGNGGVSLGTLRHLIDGYIARAAG